MPARSVPANSEDLARGLDSLGALARSRDAQARCPWARMPSSREKRERSEGS